MTIILAITGFISAVSLIVGTATLIGLVAFTDLHDRMMNWVCHKLWW